MAQKRIHEIAKERGMSSKDVLLRLRAAGRDVTAAAAEVDEAEALRALAASGPSAARPATAAQRAAAPAARGATAAPARPAATPAQRRAAAQGAAARPPAEAGADAGPADGAHSRRVFEPDGPPLEVKPRGQQGYVPPPPPPPRARPRTSEEQADRGGAQTGAPEGGSSGGREAPAAPAVGPKIVEQPTA